MTERDAIAVTGLGVVSPIGVGHAQFWSALCAGQSGIVPLAEATGVPRIAARIAAFSPREFITSPQLRRADPLSRTIVAAARMALTDAKLGTLPPEALGLVVGSALGDVGESIQYLNRLFTKGPGLASPMMFPNLVLNAAASYTAMELGSLGANLTVSHGDVSGELALTAAVDVIRSGRAEVVLAGGGDELAEIVMYGYRRFRALSGQRGGDEWCSPYDRDRNGLVLGEGAAMLVLESAQRARRRGATIYAEIADYTGFGVPASPYDWPAHAPGATVCLREWLARTLPAGATIDAVCGNANGSRRLDACLAEVCAAIAAPAAVTSIKGAIGEFGAAGALSAAATCLALHRGVVPPLCHLRQPLETPLQFAAPTAQARALRHALMFSIARGGSTLALLLRRAQ